jgi:hypothetical protein
MTDFCFELAERGEDGDEVASDKKGRSAQGTRLAPNLLDTRGNQPKHGPNPSPAKRGGQHHWCQ